MPITKAAKKALRQSLERKKRNLVKKRKVKTLQKTLKILTAERKSEEAKKLLPQIYKSIDKAAKTGAIKKNKAARKKSQAAKLFKTLSLQEK